MPPEELLNALRTHLLGAGAYLVSAGDIRMLPTEVRHDLPVGISIAVALTPAIIADITAGPTPVYAQEYERANRVLDGLGQACVAFLAARGYRAVAQQAVSYQLDRATLSTQLPHKTIATRAGLGWIGKCALLVTETYGSAIRLTSVLTDANLPTAAPIDASRCGDCTACVDVCPGHAPTGQLWQAGLERADYYDAFACARTAKGLASAQGITHILCGMCMANCPWTKRYLAKHAAVSADAC